MDTQLSEIRLTKEQAEEQLEIFRRIYSKVRLLSAEELKEENTTQAGKGEKGIRKLSENMVLLTNWVIL